jgi:hypothetical protein
MTIISNRNHEESYFAFLMAPLSVLLSFPVCGPYLCGAFVDLTCLLYSTYLCGMFVDLTCFMSGGVLVDSIEGCDVL